jgi:predicted RNA-binding protein with PIN domain
MVDGYSVLHSWPQLQRLVGRSLQHRREALVQVMSRYADHTARRVTLVFDAYAARFQPQTADRDRGIEVLFSDHGKTADDLIERLVGEAADPSEILVVTSDNHERRTVETLGAESVSCEVFELEVQDELRALAQLVHRHGRRRSIGSVRDEFDG